MYKELIEKKTFDEERSLYNQTDTHIKECIFAGPKDGESVLKEMRNCLIEDCSFSLRYALWHAEGFILKNSKMDELVRAPIWYAKKGTIDKCIIDGVKCLRETKDIKIKDSKIVSKEFGWRCSDLTIENTSIDSEYFLFECDHINLDKVNMKGKYSFQYVNRGIITNSNLDTKDAFWHSKNLTVINSVIKGEYLGWFSENLTLINCKIIGTQPLCYCKNLKLVDCTMENTDLSFEYSSVKATVKGNVQSIKNPKSGYIKCDSCDEIIRDHTVMKCNAKIIVNNQNS